MSREFSLLVSGAIVGIVAGNLFRAFRADLRLYGDRVIALENRVEEFEFRETDDRQEAQAQAKAELDEAARVHNGIPAP